MRPRMEKTTAINRNRSGAQANVQPIRILNRSDAINSNHSLDTTGFLRFIYGPWPRTRTIRPFFRHCHTRQE